MRLVTFTESDDHQKIGALLDEDGQILDLAAAWRHERDSDCPEFSSMLALIESGDSGLDKAREMLEQKPEAAIRSASECRLLAPVPRPPQIRDCLCFEEHLVQAYNVLRKNRAQAAPDPEAALKEFEKKGMFRVPDVFYQHPIYYKANRFSVIGTETDVLWPTYADVLDFELEFGFFIGKTGKDIPKEKAREHIFGYSIFNDISARDTQAVEMPGLLGPAKSKDFDTGNIIGPCITTADEIDPYDLTMIARINGEEWARNSSSTIHWTFEDLISYVSRGETLHAGEFFGSGTVGTGCGLEQERYLSPGDVVELEVEGIGILRNRVVKP